MNNSPVYNHVTNEYEVYDPTGALVTSGATYAQADRSAYNIRLQEATSMNSPIVSARLPQPLAAELKRQCTTYRIRPTEAVVAALVDWLDFDYTADPRSAAERAADADLDDLYATQADLRADMRGF